MWVFTLGSRVDETLDLYPTSKGMPSGLATRSPFRAVRFAFWVSSYALYSTTWYMQNRSALSGILNSGNYFVVSFVRTRFFDGKFCFPFTF